MMNKDLTPRTIKLIGLIFFICILIILAINLFFVQKITINKFYNVKIKFNFIANLKPGADVKFIGGPSKRAYDLGKKP